VLASWRRRLFFFVVINWRPCVDASSIGVEVLEDSGIILGMDLSSHD